jgi:Methyltransferase domain
LPTAKKCIGLALDPMIALGTLICSPLLRALTYSKGLPITRKALDRVRVSVIGHHYYSPLVLPEDISRPLSEPRNLPAVDLNIENQLSLVRQFHYADELRAIPVEQTSHTRFAFHNGSFEVGDAEMLYNMVRYFKPRQFIEIGCGQSTLISLLAQKRNKEEDSNYSCRHICIEPYEQPWLEGTAAQVIRKRVEDMDVALIAGLGLNDILFIDSSHVIRPQGDVLHEYLYLLGTVRPGVLVHVHDVFTPRDYLGQWVLKERRMWNEQYLLEAFLSFNHDFQILAAVNLLSHDYRHELQEACPLLIQETDHEPGSFWMQRCDTNSRDRADANAKAATS